MRGVSASLVAGIVVVVSAGAPIQAQEISGLGEVFGSIVSPTTIGAEPAAAPTPPASPRRRAAEVIRARAADPEDLQPAQVVELNRIAGELETAQTDIGPAVTELRNLATGAEELVAATLQTLAYDVEDTREPGWYLAAGAAANVPSVSLTKVKDPSSIAVGTLIGLAPQEPLYRVVAVAATAGGVDLTLSPATRHVYPPAADQKIVIRPERVVFFAVPTLRDNEDRLSSTLGLGGGYRGFEVSVSYTNTDASGGGKDIETRFGRLKVPLRGRLHSNYNNQAALSVDSSETRTLRQRHRAVLSGNLGLDGGFCRFECRTNLVANVGWAWDEPKAGEDVDDLVAGVGLSHSFRPAILLAVDYSIENDLDRQDTFSASLTKKFPDSSRLTFGAQKHGVIFMSYVTFF